MNFIKQFLILAFIAIGFSSSEKFSFEGYKIVSLLPINEQQVRLISELQNNQDFDVLNSIRIPNKNIYVVLSSEAFYKYAKVFRTNQIDFKIVDSNLQKQIDDEQESMVKNSQKRDASPKNIVGRFARYNEIMNYIDQLVADDPLLASSYVIGKTSEGRNIKALVLGTSTSNKGIFIDCGFHAREWIAVSSCIYLIDKIVYHFNEGDGVWQNALSKYAIHIVPLVNADGYEYSHTTFRMWRKNRVVNRGSSCIGVDLNRNFGFQWMKGGSSSNPCSDTYAGPSADSELETKAIENAINAKPNFWDAYLTIHTYGEFWLTSWSYSLDYPPDFNDLIAAAQDGARGIRLVQGTNYTVGHSARLFGILSGVSDDWAKGAANIKYSYTLELSPGNSGTDASFGFTLPENRAPRVGQELYNGVRFFVDSIYKKLYGNN